VEFGTPQFRVAALEIVVIVVAVGIWLTRRNRHAAAP
jgi:hypothetical protein